MAALQRRGAQVLHAPAPKVARNDQDEQFVVLTAGLEESTILARGPKALGAVRAAGLDDDDASPSETTASLVDRVVELGFVGLRVAVQLHGYTGPSAIG